MFAQMKHLAIVSDNLEGMCRFYERAFGMRGTGVLRAGALVVGDGYVKHFALRALQPQAVAEFYRDVLELQELEKPADDPNDYLPTGGSR